MIKPPTNIVNRRARSIERRARGLDQAPPTQPREAFRCGCFDLSTEPGRVEVLRLYQMAHERRIRLERESEEVKFTSDGKVLYHIEWRDDAPEKSPIPAGFEYVVPRYARRFGIAVQDITTAAGAEVANEIAGRSSIVLFYRNRKILDDGRCMVLLMWYEDHSCDIETIPPPR